MSHRHFIERLIIAIAIIGLALLLFQLRHLFMLVFGAVLVAVIFRIIANPLARRLRLPDGVAVLLAVLCFVGVFGLAFGMFGAEAMRQATSLQETIPQAWQAVQARLQSWGLAEPVNQWIKGLRQSGGGMFSNLGTAALAMGNGIADALLVLVGGIYLAAQPRLYRTGVVKLVPEGARDRIIQAFEDSWAALRLWLMGRLISMIIVGILTGVGLWLIGIPGALALAVVAFILEFVPFVGPIIAAIPAVLLALAHDPVKSMWAAGLYLLVQQIEGNLVEPLVQQRAVDLPPALLLFSLVAGGIMFGAIGIIFAAPLLVVLFVTVKRLYVREALNTPTEIPGEKRS